MAVETIEIHPTFTTQVESNPGGVRIITTMGNLMQDLEPYGYKIAQAIYAGGSVKLVIEVPDPTPLSSLALGGGMKEDNMCPPSLRSSGKSK